VEILSDAFLKGKKFLALSTIRTGWKGLSGKNILPYLASSLMMKKEY
jgi:hypothetical protein